LIFGTCGSPSTLLSQAYNDGACLREKIRYQAGHKPEVTQEA